MTTTMMVAVVGVAAATVLPGLGEQMGTLFDETSAGLAGEPISSGNGGTGNGGNGEGGGDGNENQPSAPEHPATAGDDALTVTPSGPTTITIADALLQNDTGIGLVFDGIVNDGGLTIVDNANGTLTLTPPSGAAEGETASFTYRVATADDTAEATVTVTYAIGMLVPGNTSLTVERFGIVASCARWNGTTCSRARLTYNGVTYGSECFNLGAREVYCLIATGDRANRPGLTGGTESQFRQFTVWPNTQSCWTGNPYTVVELPDGPDIGFSNANNFPATETADTVICEAWE